MHDRRRAVETGLCFEYHIVQVMPFGMSNSLSSFPPIMGLNGVWIPSHTHSLYVPNPHKSQVLTAVCKKKY